MGFPFNFKDNYSVSFKSKQNRHIHELNALRKENKHFWGIFRHYPWNEDTDPLTDLLNYETTDSGETTGGALKVNLFIMLEKYKILLIKNQTMDTEFLLVVIIMEMVVDIKINRKL